MALFLFNMNIYSFDLDGTLLPKHFGTIKTEIYEKINSFIDKGDVVIFNSGRPFGILRKYMDPIHESNNVYFSINNGSALLNQNGEIIYSKPAPNKMLKELKKENPNLSIFTYTLEDELLTFEENDITKYESKVNEMISKVISLNDDLSNYVMLKFLVCGSKDELDNVVINYDKKKYTLIRTKDTMMEIMRKDADKVTAIDYVVSLYKNIDNIFTFGDADNDVESIKKYFGVTFSNGTKLCKDNAKYISPKFADDGVLDAFNYFSL